MKKVFLATGLLLFMVSCGGKQKQAELEGEIAEIKMEQRQKDFEDSLIRLQAEQAAAEEVEDRVNPAASTPRTSGSNSSATASSGTTKASSGNTEAPKEKKKMGNVVKGALIGAGSGAVVGAVVSKKKPGKGALIGAAAGAAAGAGTGAIVNAEKKRKAEAE